MFELYNVFYLLVSAVSADAYDRLEKVCTLRIIPSSERFSLGTSTLLDGLTCFPQDWSSAEPNAAKVNPEIT